MSIRDQIDAAIAEAHKNGSEPEMVMMTLEQYKQMLPVVTQARYFHYVESDGQKVMVGFQTHRELMEYMVRTDENEERADKLCDLLGSRTNHDVPTIREASE